MQVPVTVRLFAVVVPASVVGPETLRLPAVRPPVRIVFPRTFKVFVVVVWSTARFDADNWEKPAIDPPFEFDDRLAG